VQKVHFVSVSGDEGEASITKYHKPIFTIHSKLPTTTTTTTATTALAFCSARTLVGINHLKDLFKVLFINILGSEKTESG